LLNYLPSFQDVLQK